MSKITALQKKQNPIQFCKNKTVTDEYILKYQESTKNAVEQILNMGLAVKEVYYKSKNGVLNEYDLNYFCQSVGLKQKSSSFRKYKCIGEKANIFKQYMNKMPKSFSVLYEIATLDADLFDSLVINGGIDSSITLDKLKKLANKKTFVPARNKISSNNPSFLSKSTISKIVKDINRFGIYVYTDLNEKDYDDVIKTFEKLQENKMIRFDAPSILELSNEELEITI